MKLTNMMPRNFKSLLIKSLKEKRNWFVLSAVILIVTVIIVPLLMERAIEEANIVVGIIEMFIIVFVNVLLDFSYLHNARKFTYYLSKPLTNIQMINIVILSNLIFSMFFMGLLFVVSALLDFNLTHMFVVPVPWMIIGIFVSALSSLLAGNTVIAGVATIFNFVLPVSLLGVIYFGMSIVENMALGFSSNMIMEKFIKNIYRIDYLYFIELVNKPNWLIFSGLLVTVPLILYWIINQLSKTRKNERIGDQVVFTGYKNFVALLVSTLIPLAFSTVLYNNDYIAKLISFVILGSITFYIAIAVFEKSFIIGRAAFKLLAVFMVVFVGFIFTTGAIVKHFESYVPESNDILAAYISDSNYIYIEDEKDINGINDLNLSLARKYDEIKIYESETAIEAIKNIQKSVIHDQKYNQYGNIYIIYFLANDKKVSRYYTLNYEYSEDTNKREINGDLDKFAQTLEATDEYKMENLKFVYDDDFTEDWQVTEIEVMGEETIKLYLNKEELWQFRKNLQSDLNKKLSEEENSLMMVLRQDFSAYFEGYRNQLSDVKERDIYTTDVNIRIKYGTTYDQYVYLGNVKTATTDYIFNLINKE